MQHTNAVRWPNSLRLYHFESKNSEPGKNAASTNPRKNRVNSAPTKLSCVRRAMISTLRIGY